MKKLAILFVILAGYTVTANAQGAAVFATASSKAVVITPITIAKTTDLVLGTLAVSATTGGTLVMDATGGRTSTLGVTLPVNSGSPTAAVFHVTGLDGSTFAITLPGTISLSDGASHTMNLGSFVSSPSSTGTLSGGAADISVGGTLTVAAAQAAGTYTNAAGLQVTVNYN